LSKALVFWSFVLVRDENTANRLIELNGWGKIAPLKGTCKNLGNDDNKIPEWTAPKWTRPELEALLRSRYGDGIDTGAMVLENEDGGNAYDVLQWAIDQYSSEGKSLKTPM
jgi:hypothetical protein